MIGMPRRQPVTEAADQGRRPVEGGDATPGDLGSTREIIQAPGRRTTPSADLGTRRGVEGHDTESVRRTSHRCNVRAAQ
jgi:hypothetical protein